MLHPITVVLVALIRMRKLINLFRQMLALTLGCGSISFVRVGFACVDELFVGKAKSMNEKRNQKINQNCFFSMMIPVGCV